jgi:hypothetical protein
MPTSRLISWIWWTLLQVVCAAGLIWSAFTVEGVFVALVLFGPLLGGIQAVLLRPRPIWLWMLASVLHTLVPGCCAIFAFGLSASNGAAPIDDPLNYLREVTKLAALAGGLTGVPTNLVSSGFQALALPNDRSDTAPWVLVSPCCQAAGWLAFWGASHVGASFLLHLPPQEALMPLAVSAGAVGVFVYSALSGLALLDQLVAD